MYYWLLRVTLLNTVASTVFMILNQRCDGLKIWSIKSDLFGNIFDSDEGIVG